MACANPYHHRSSPDTTVIQSVLKIKLKQKMSPGLLLGQEIKSCLTSLLSKSDHLPKLLSVFKWLKITWWLIICATYVKHISCKRYQAILHQNNNFCNKLQSVFGQTDFYIFIYTLFITVKLSLTLKMCFSREIWTRGKQKLQQM